MSKEWLEEVKDTYQSVESLIELGDFKQADIAMCYLVENFGKWLIKQAERVEELEKEIKRLKDALSGSAVIFNHSQATVKELTEKNKRYREALEFYANEDNWIGTITSIVNLSCAVEQDQGEIARKALEK